MSKSSRRMVVPLSMVALCAAMAAPGSASATASGTRQTAVILINFVDNRAQPWTQAQVRGAMYTRADSVRTFWIENSGGSVYFRGKVDANDDVFGWYELAVSSAGCNFSDWAERAKDRARGAGHDLSGYDHFIIAFPKVPACGFAGISYQPGNTVWLNGDFIFSDGSPSSTVMHELGHNFGLAHANTLRCFGPSGSYNVDTGNCSPSEAGDPFDPMGSGRRQLSGWHKARAGIPPVGIAPADQFGDYVIWASNVFPTPLPRLLRVPRTTNLFDRFLDYYVDYRRPSGVFDNFSADSPAVNGVMIRKASTEFTEFQGEVHQPELVDATPWTVTHSDAALPLGKSFWNVNLDQSLTTIAVGPDYAVVRYSAGPPPGHSVATQFWGVLAIATAAGVPNQIRIEPSGSSAVRITNATAQLAAGIQCGYVAEQDVRCTLNAGAPIVVSFAGGPQVDTMFAQNITVPMDVTMRGGGDFTITGSGNDVIRARNGVGSDIIACGNGVDTVEYDGGDWVGPDCEILR